MPLGIVAGSEVQTPSSGNPLEGGSFRNAAVAKGKLQSGAADAIGGFFQDVSQNIQANRNARMVFDADLSMRKTKDDFTASLAKMPDEGTWLQAWKQNVDTVRQGVLDNPHAGPEVRRVLSQKFDSWEQATTAEVRTAALLKGAKETRESAIADSTYAAHQGDIEGAHNVLNAAVAHFAMSAADAKKVGARFESIAAQAKADTAIATNPINAPELIKQFESKIEPAVYIGVVAKANEAKNREQATNLNAVAEQMDSSPDGTIDPKVLSEKVKAKEITQRGADGLMARMKRQNYAESKDEHSIAMMRADDHDWVDDKNAEQSAREMKADYAGLPPALRKSVYEHIDAKVNAAKKKGEAAEKPVEKEMFERMKEDRDKNGLTIPMIAEDVAATSHWFSPDQKASTNYKHFTGGLTRLRSLTDDEVKEEFGEGMTKQKAIAAEELHYAQQQTKMRSWFKANPDATDEKAEEYRRSIERPYIMAAAKDSLLKHVPVQITSQEEFDALPAGAPFIHNGRTGVKN